MRYTLVPMTLALLGFTGQCVQAQEPIFGMSPAMYSNWAALTPMRERLEKNHQTLFGQSVEASLGSSRSGAAPRSAATLDRQGSRVNGVPTTFRNQPVAVGQGISRVMAQPYLEANRAEVQQVFEQLLTGFKKIESQLGLPSNDFAAAVAAFIVGNYSVFHGAPVPDQHFVTLVDQMRHVIGNTPAFLQASPITKQETYEQLAILGMFMAPAKWPWTASQMPRQAPRPRQPLQAICGPSWIRSLSACKSLQAV